MSRGYQRLFAEPESERIALHDTREGWTRPVGTRDAFAENDFNAYTDEERGKVDDLEDEWQRVESAILPGARALAEGDETPLFRDAARVLAAMHFARSYSFDMVLGRILAKARAEIGPEFAAKPKIRAEWVRERGREPEAGELERDVLEGWDDHMGTGRFRLDQMVSGYGKALERLRPLEVQIIRAEPRVVPFITGDTPVVHWTRFPGTERGPAFRVGINDGLAIGDADHIYMPLGPWVSVMFTTHQEEDQIVAPFVVQQLNWPVWRASMRFVAGHPDTDFRRAVGGLSPRPHRPAP